MSKATFPETTGNESQKPLMDGAVVSSDMRNALSALFQGDISPLRARAQSMPNMTVIVNPASIQNFFKQVNRNKQPVTFSGGNSPSITAPTTNSRIDILYLNNSGNLAWIAGSEAASPMANWSSLPDDGIPICTAYCKVGMTAIVNFEDSGANLGQGYIYEDVRPLINMAVSSVTKFKVGSFTRDVSIASGNQSITGLGGKPKAVIFLSIGLTTVQASWGFDDGTTAREIDRLGNSGNMNHESASVGGYIDGSNYYFGVINSFDSDGFTIAWTRTGSPTGTLSIKYIALF